ACTCGIYDAPVATKANERAVIDYAFAHDLVKPRIPKVRTGKKVAVIGSGPAGLAAADQLNQRGHLVTVYERKDRPGGLLMYGIPNMKLEKETIFRRIRLMEEEGIRFLCNQDVGKDICAEELLQEYDRVILACGASEPRDIRVPGREVEGICFAVDFLSQVTKSLLDSEGKKLPYEMVKGKKVLVIGGGDTGNDCVGTSIRLGAESVIQLEMMPKAPDKRAESNPWPQWPRILKTDYGQQEAIAEWGEDPRVYETTVTEFIPDDAGKVRAAKVVELEAKKEEGTGRMQLLPKAGSEREIAVDLVLIAAGFLGSQAYIREAFDVECNERTNVKTPADSYATTRDRVFAAGDMRRGQSLVVWAIAEGRRAAREADESMMGYSHL
ncbi:MAG: glutamate synthase subunit beta, partial [Lachnospiraceae bacterium]|nr:glutamate synthase subunit beta [Lachnospiraceae bacterium]